MDEFSELRDAWAAFVSPFWDLIGRIKTRLSKMLDRVLLYYKKED
jgi:hypothetical protein